MGEGNYFQGSYIYAIIESKGHPELLEFGNLGIGDRGDRVYTVNFKDLAAVVSSSPVEKLPVSRDNTLAHQKVLEKVMEKFTILPVRFCTIAENEKNIQEKVLKARYQEFKNLLFEMKDKVELGVRAVWANIEKIFGEILEENKDIEQLKEKIAKESSLAKRHAGMIKIGEMVQKALGEKKEKEAREILAVFKPLSVETRVNKVYGDRNILKAAFLVKETREKEFDQKINQLEKELGGRTSLKYFGPVPPYNFVEVVVTW